MPHCLKDFQPLARKTRTTSCRYRTQPPENASRFRVTIMYAVVVPVPRPREYQLAIQVPGSVMVAVRMNNHRTLLIIVHYTKGGSDSGHLECHAHHRRGVEGAAADRPTLPHSYVSVLEHTRPTAQCTREADEKRLPSPRCPETKA